MTIGGPSGDLLTLGVQREAAWEVDSWDWGWKNPGRTWDLKEIFANAWQAAQGPGQVANRAISERLTGCLAGPCGPPSGNVPHISSSTQQAWPRCPRLRIVQDVYSTRLWEVRMAEIPCASGHGVKWKALLKRFPHGHFFLLVFLSFFLWQGCKCIFDFYSTFFLMFFNVDVESSFQMAAWHFLVECLFIYILFSL